MKRALFLLPLLLAIGCATVGPAVPPAARAELAPTGKLRVALLAPNPIFVTQNTPSGITRGLAVDIAGQLASRLDVPIATLRYESVGALMESAARDEWDITFLPISPERAAVVNFSAPYLYSENSLIVPANSSANAIADLDRPGKTIVAVARSTQDTWLRRNIKSATLVNASSPAAAQEMLREGKIDAYASATSLLANMSRQIAGSRVLAGSFEDSPVGMAVKKPRPAGFAYAFEFIEQMKSSGAIQEAISREGLTGVRAAR